MQSFAQQCTIWLPIFYVTSNTLSSKLQSIGIFCDLSKAFDCIDSAILLSKLMYKLMYRVSGISHSCFQSYLSNRTQVTKIPVVKNGIEYIPPLRKSKQGFCRERQFSLYFSWCLLTTLSFQQVRPASPYLQICLKHCFTTVLKTLPIMIIIILPYSVSFLQRSSWARRKSCGSMKTPTQN